MFCNGIRILFFRFSNFFPSSFSQNFHVRFFEEQKRPSGPPERALSPPRNLFFLPSAIAEASRSVPVFFRTPSERFSLSDGMLFPRVRPSFLRRPRFYPPFLLSCPLRFLTPHAPLFVFFRELPLLFPPFFLLSTRSHSSRGYFHSFQNSFSQPFPALCFF